MPERNISDVMTGARKINVTLGFLVDVEGDVDPKWVGQELCRLITAPQIGNPNFIATPTGVVFLEATETPQPPPAPPATPGLGRPEHQGKRR